MRKLGLVILFLVILALMLVADHTKPPRFEIELSGGLTAANPQDLNLIVESEKKFNFFYINQAYTYLRNIDYINSYIHRMTGQYGKLNHTTPLEIRIKARTGPSLAFSLGVKYFKNRKNFNVSEEFIIEEKSGNISSDIVEYAPFELEAQALVVSAGIHYGINLGRMFRLEGFLAAGPIFGECLFSFAYSQSLRYGDSGIGIESDMALEVSGEGHGFSYEGGIQFQFRINKRLAVFVSGGYVQQIIDKLSGRGAQDMYGYTQEWQGKLGIKEATYYKSWGSTTIRWPSNFWEGEEFLKQRDMELDLSGFQLKFGIILGI